MAPLTRTRAVQVATVRESQRSAELALTSTLEAAGIDVGDTLAFAVDRDAPAVVASRIGGSVTIDAPTRQVRRKHRIALPVDYCGVLDVTAPTEAEDGAVLGRVVAYAAEDGPTIALGPDVGPAVEPVEK